MLAQPEGVVLQSELSALFGFSLEEELIIARCAQQCKLIEPIQLQHNHPGTYRLCVVTLLAELDAAQGEAQVLTSKASYERTCSICDARPADGPRAVASKGQGATTNSIRATASSIGGRRCFSFTRPLVCDSVASPISW